MNFRSNLNLQNWIVKWGLHLLTYYILIISLSIRYEIFNNFTFKVHISTRPHFGRIATMQNINRLRLNNKEWQMEWCDASIIKSVLKY